MHWNRSLPTGFILAALITAPVGSARAQSFTSIDVTGALSTEATGINESGQIVGNYTRAQDCCNLHGFLLSAGACSRIEPPGAISSQTSGINNSGQVVGTYWDGSSFHGFLFSEGAYTTIDVPEAVFLTQANGINNQGEIVGAYIPHISLGISRDF